MSTAPPTHEPSFAETALRLGGKSEAEVKKTGALDRADDQVETFFAPQYQTINSPIHRAVWDRDTPFDLFVAEESKPSAACAQAIKESLDVARKHKETKTVFDSQGKVSKQVLDELGKAGYWGMLIDPAYGGLGAPLTVFGPLLTKMAMIEPTIAGLASVHGCIGAVDPVRTFGNAEQKLRFLPKLASGERLSAFALTEPCAGSDLTALRTRAVLDGDRYLVTGEKLFITNVVPGRTIGLVCLIDDKPAVLIADLPDHEDDRFQLVKYGLHALKHAHNQGIRFNDFPVPKENLLVPARGDGLTVAYHGLNHGRVALCATAAGSMRVMLANLLPWARFRKTYGESIDKRELVRARIGKLAGRIVAADALVLWCGTLLDRGYRGEMECTIAKIFGSEAQKEVAIEFFMKTHGGRSFLHGHLFGDNVHEFLAPCIYEGEGDVLSLAFFKSLIKQHGTTFFEPVGKALVREKLRSLNPANPLHAWKLRQELVPYMKWWMTTALRHRGSGSFRVLSPPLARLAQAALNGLKRSPLELSGAMRKHQLRLADRQCRIADMSMRVQNLVTALVTCLHAGRSENELVQQAGELMAEELLDKHVGRRPSDDYLRRLTRLGEHIAEGGFSEIAGVTPDEILMSYEP